MTKESEMMSKQREAWNRLIEHAVDENARAKSFNVDMVLDIQGKAWKAYGAEVSYRQVTFYCKQGWAQYDINTVGYRTGAVLNDWEEGHDE